ncbi:MAG: hypothetical protein PHT19_17500 [Methylococcus sp.]|nr:hypothetical protein [Methylococcus sp.]
MTKPAENLTGPIARAFRLIVVDVHGFRQFVKAAGKEPAKSSFSNAWLRGHLIDEQRRVTRAIYAVGMVFAGDDPFFDAFVELAAGRAELEVEARFRRLNDGELDTFYGYETAVETSGLCCLDGEDRPQDRTAEAA